MVSYEIPSEFTDEEKWLKFFPRKAFIAGGVCMGVGVIFANILKGAGLFVPVLVFFGIITAVMVLLIMVKKPEGDYLKGSGQAYGDLLIKRILRKRKSCIYVLGYDDYKRYNVKKKNGKKK